MMQMMSSTLRDLRIQFCPECMRYCQKCQLFHVFCTIQFSYYSFSSDEERGNSKKHKRAIESSDITEVTTTNTCNVLLLLHRLVPY